MIFVAVISIVLVMFFTSTEIAFVASNHIRISVFSDTFKLKKILNFVYNHPSVYLSTAIVGTNIFVVLFTMSLRNILNNDILTLIISTLIIFIIGELLPKSLTLKSPEKYACFSSMPLFIFYILLYPIIFTINIFLKTKKEGDIFNKAELVAALEQSESHQVVENIDKMILTNILYFSEKQVLDLMTPRIDIVAFEKGEGIENIARSINEGKRHSKIPIYENDIDHIVGIIRLEDLIFKYPDSIEEILIPAEFISDKTNCADAFEKLVKSKSGIGIVIDEYGGTEGIITIDDVIYGIFGKTMVITHKSLEKRRKGVYIIPGKRKIEEVKFILGFPFPGEYQETLSGYIIRILGRVPVEGEEIKIGNFKITIIDGDEKRIKKVRIEAVEYVMSG